MNKIGIGALVLAASLAVSATLADKISVVLAGKNVTVDSVSLNGKTYVSLDQLKAQLNGAKPVATAAGGANQLGAAEGVKNEWLFNGVWRFRVTEVQWSGEDNSWNVSVEIKNGYKKSIRPTDAGFAFNGSDGFFLTYSDGNTQEPFLSAASDIQDYIGLKMLPPGGGSKMTIRFSGEKELPPIKLLVQFEPKAGYPLIKEPSFRVDLTHSK